MGVMTIAGQMGGAVVMTIAGHMGGAIVGGKPELLEVRKAGLSWRPLSFHCGDLTDLR